MTTWASHHFESCCSVTVFPVPKPPGMAAVPPFAIGKRKSRTRWPVTRGIVGISRSFTGRAFRRDHDAMLDVLRFLHRPHDVAWPDKLALFHLGSESPRFLAGESWRLEAT